ncbi:Integrin alpha N-terminal domain-containing protein [Dioscorea alata]|uniref:Integrin alpha N-terminal domain-containing protein n=1 Tax=Dioscorea alata TaxID=55571 RepID=A0ACB7V4W8_DIOAL|nr:Integrin alpha N-terminal domain-containing protein [Dioscorea alata]
MRKRDLGILLLSALAIFFTLQQEGDFSFKEAWFHLSDEYPIKYEAERLPPPIVADLNGDGKKEVLIATHDAKIQVLEPHSRRGDEGFSEAQVLAEVSLLPDKIRVASGRRPVAMATGVINRFYKHGEIKKQVLVVVTSGWSVMCFDHNLKKLWENNLQEHFPHGSHHREIAISISNYTLKHGDSGLVIIGGRMEMQHQSTMDLFEETLASEKSSESQRRSATETEASGDSPTVDLRHFAFFAFAGQSGSLRWSRKNENIEAHSSDASQLIPQHNYKLDVHSLNSRHPGEFECREFRESILGVMPHQWDRREDTRFELAHFRRHKRKSLKKTPGKVTASPFHKPVENHPPGKDPSNKIANLIGKAANYAGSAKANKGVHYIPTITNHTRLWWVPNVVLAHQKEGIEAVHLASGRTICKLHLPEGGLHADINGDGVLDHVQVVGGNGAEQAVVSGSMEVLKPCWAVGTSGVPVREQLFNVSICHHAHFSLFHHGDFARSFGRNTDASLLEVASPILIQRDDGHKHRKRSHGDVIFLTNRGEVTSYSSNLHGHDAIWRWQLLTGATWSNLPSPSGMTEATVVPTLKAFSLGKFSKQEIIIAAGDQEAVVISPEGSQLATFDLPSPPTHTLVLEDFSGDGLTDVIVVSSSGTYGFVQVRHPGALFFSTLVGCLIVIIAVIFVSQHLKSINKSKPRASTDYR